MLIIDTMNILHTVGILPPDLAGIDVPSLAHLIAHSRFRAERTVFVCDGLPTSDLPPSGPLVVEDGADDLFEVRYSGRESIADDLIKRMIDASTAPRRLIVVSSDHEIQRHARKRRSAALSSESFLGLLADDARLPRPTSPLPRKPSSMSDAQVQKWIDVFNVDVPALEEIAESQALPSDATTSIETSVSLQTPTTARTMAADDGTDAVQQQHADANADDVLPPELITEAESLVQQHVRPTMPITRSSPVDDRTPGDPANEHIQHDASPSSATDESASGAAHSDHDELDMNAILPDDGMTRPIRKRNNRYRPAG